MPDFRVNLKKVVDDSYDIEIGSGLTGSLANDLAGGLAGDVYRYVVVTDSGVDKLYAEPICAALKAGGLNVIKIVFPAGEESKTRETKAYVEDEMLAAGCRRDTCVVAVGGGVVTDLAGFVAGTFGRGVPYVNFATTLLAAADASVGGKTAVDTPLATNLIGLFWQPRKVYIDIGTWRTLPEREFSSGLAETVKHAVMADAGFFSYLEDNIGRILKLDEDALLHIAETNCRIKYNVVMQDERESGMREILNLGHTIGRAVETESGYRLLHGEAVAIGLAYEARLAARLGKASEEDAQRVVSLLGRCKLPTKIPDYVDRESLIRRLYTDKKVRKGHLRFVVQEGIGGISLWDGKYAVSVDEETIREIISDGSL